MKRLVLVELRRLRWRRACLVLAAAAVVAPLVIALFTMLDRDLPGGDDSELREQYAQEAKFYEREVGRCERKPRRYGVDPDSAATECQRLVGLPPFEEYRSWNGNFVDLRGELTDGSGIAVAAVVGIAAFLLGATFVGHDWNTGSMSNQMLFESQRLRVWSGKALALVAFTTVVAGLGLTLWWLVLCGWYTTGSEPIPDGLLADGLWQMLRGTGLAAAAALGGYALTMLSRSTVFTLGVLFGVSVAGGLLIAAAGIEDRGPVDPTINALAVIVDGVDYYIEVPARCYESDVIILSDECDDAGERTLAEGATYFGGLLVLLCAGSAISFRQRDLP